VLIEAVLLVVFANLPGLPALAAHKIHAGAFAKSQPRSIGRLKKGRARPGSLKWRRQPEPIGIALKCQ